jgi:small subunit ribosomal protein S13
MARIAGVDLPRRKKLLWALTYIFGIGLTTSKKILATTKIDPDTRTDDLTDDEVARIKRELEDHYTVEGDLRREIAMNIDRLKRIRCFRGIRHIRGLPCRGQRTKTNARTRRGRRKMTPGKKKVG